jgi:plasmid stability protein
MKTAPSDNQDKFIIRMPNGLRDRIKKRADANNRSMNAEIVQVLEKQYPEPTDVMYVHAENIRIALDLYEAETDPDARMRLQIMVEGMATMGHSLEIDWNEEEWSE